MKSKRDEYAGYIALYILGLGVAHSASLWASLIIVNLSPAAHTGNIADNSNFWLTRDFPLYHAVIQAIIFGAAYLVGAAIIIWALRTRTWRHAAWSALTAVGLLIIWTILDSLVFQSLLSSQSYNAIIELAKDTLIPALFYVAAWRVAARIRQPGISDDEL